MRGEGPVNTRAVRNAGENSGRGRRSEEKHGLEKDRRWRTQGVEGSRIVRVVIGRDSPAAIRALDDVETEKEREREKETDGQMDGRTGGRTDREEYRKIEREKKTERREKGGWEG